MFFLKRDVDDDTSYDMVSSIFKYHLAKFFGDAYPSGDYFLAKLCLMLFNIPVFMDNFDKNFSRFEGRVGASRQSLLSAPRLFLKRFDEVEVFRARLLLRDRQLRKSGGLRLLRKYLSVVPGLWLFEANLLIVFMFLVVGSPLERVLLSRQEVWYADDYSAVSKDVDDKGEGDK